MIKTFWIDSDDYPSKDDFCARLTASVEFYSSKYGDEKSWEVLGVLDSEGKEILWASLSTRDKTAFEEQFKYYGKAYL